MIKISDKYYIKADTNNYMLVEKIIIYDKKSKNFGKERFEILGYYASLECLLNGLIKTELRKYISKQELNSISDLKNKIIELEKFIKSLNLNI